jgi:hypothetical protein
MHNPAVTLPKPLAWLGLTLLYGVVGCGDLTDERPAKWSFISATIAEPQCATVNCHSAVAKRDNLDLSSRDVGICYNPKSFVENLKMPIGKVRRMPPDAPLPAADIELWAKWAATDGTNDMPPPEGFDAFCAKVAAQ